MTSCPAESDLLALVDGDLDSARAEELTDHLALCPECALSLARAEAALCYALGGLADQERTAIPAAPTPRAVPWPQGVAALAAAVLLAAGIAALGRSDAGPRSHEATVPAPTESAAASHLDVLLSRARALAAQRDTPADHAAVAALAAAEAREVAIGPGAGQAGYLGVIAAFPGSPEAQRAVEALDRLSTFGGTR